MVYFRKNRRSGHRGVTPLTATERLENRSLLSPVKFFAVDDGVGQDSVHFYGHDDPQTPGDQHLHAGAATIANRISRGIATVATGDRLWVIDAGNLRVFVYDNNGTMLGSWRPNLPIDAQPEGIATDGTDIWIVTSVSSLYGSYVYRYPGAASTLSGGSQTVLVRQLPPAFRFCKDLVYGHQNGTEYLWGVTDTGYLDHVFRLGLDANRLPDPAIRSQWVLDPANSSPTGITLDPSNGSMDIWVSDIGTDQVYRYENGRAGRPTATFSFPLDSTNGNVQGIADPPPTSEHSGLASYPGEHVSPTADSQRPVVNRVSSSASKLWSAGFSSDAISVSLISTNPGRTSEFRSNNYRRSDRITAGTAKQLNSLPDSAQQSTVRAPELQTANPQQLDMIFSELSQFP